MHVHTHTYMRMQIYFYVGKTLFVRLKTHCASTLRNYYIQIAWQSTLGSYVVLSSTTCKYASPEEPQLQRSQLRQNVSSPNLEPQLDSSQALPQTLCGAKFALL